MKIRHVLSCVARGVLYWIKNNAISLDQFANTFFLFGSSDETISARCWRLRSHRIWGNARRLIDKILWFDKNHCEESFKSELRAAQLPKDYRPDNTASR